MSGPPRISQRVDRNWDHAGRDVIVERPSVVAGDVALDVPLLFGVFDAVVVCSQGVVREEEPLDVDIMTDETNLRFDQRTVRGQTERDVHSNGIVTKAHRFEESAMRWPSWGDALVEQSEPVTVLRDQMALSRSAQPDDELDLHH